ncbi:MAG: hypothetical protein CMI13_00270 [Oleibacter sp.]|nr:hypothetical protein [Thalassolituus sp.]
MKIVRYSRQKGIATILVVLLLSLAVAATAFSMINHNRNTQTKQVAVHAATHANNGAWAAADTLRLFLKNVAESDLLLLEGNTFSMQVGGDTSRAMSATVQSVTADTAEPGTYLINSLVSSTDNSAEATALMDVVFRLTPGEITDVIELADSVMLSGNLDMTGGIQITGSDGNMQDLSVDGDIRIDQVSINSIRNIQATGDVYLGSGATADSIYSNGNVTLTGSVAVGTVKATGTFEAQSGSSSVDSIWVNGDVTLDSSGSFNYVNTRSNITTNAWTTFGSLRAGKNIDAKAFGQINSLASKGDTRFGVGSPVGVAKIEGNLIGCVGDYWNDFTSIDVGGTVSSDCSELIIGGQNVLVEVMEEVKPVELEKVVIDVWALKSKANYVLEYDEVRRAPMATLYNVNGIPDGTKYYLNKYFPVNNSQHYGYLCEADTVSYLGDLCVEPEPGPAICLGFSDQNDCLKYDRLTDTWEFNGAALAPGIFWFKGELAMGTTTTTSTLMATGNISTSGAYYGAAVNWFGYDDICLGKNSLIRDKYGADSGMDRKYSARFAGYYPTNLCDMVNHKYVPDSAGNAGLIAGGYDPDGDGSYGGGDISLSASSEVWGQVLAGDVIATGGGTVIHGAITSAALGDGSVDGNDGNKLSGSTTVEVDESDTYDGDEITDTSGETKYSGNKVNVVWARYN